MNDKFDLDEFDNKEKKELTNKNKFFSVLAYVPFLNLYLLFTEQFGTEKEEKKYIKQGITIFVLYIIIFTFISFFNFRLSFLLTFIYFGVIMFFGAKAYNGLYVKIGFIENIIKQFENKNDKTK